MRQRLPLVLSATALLVALLGSTPLGHAAAETVRVALFAKNAGKVNKIRASRTPTANRLVPLGENARFPASTMSLPVAYSVRRAGPVALANALETVASVRLPRGRYWMFGKAWVRNDSGSEGAAVTCRLTAGRASDETSVRAAESALRNARSLALPLTLVAQLDGPRRARLACSDFGDGRVRAFDVRIAALRVARISATTVG